MKTIPYGRQYIDSQDIKFVSKALKQQTKYQIQNKTKVMYKQIPTIIPQFHFYNCNTDFIVVVVVVVVVIVVYQ